MQSRKALTSRSGFNLMQKDILDSSGNIIIISYEVEDANEEVIGRFGSLAEADNFITLLSNLNSQNLMGQDVRA